jgi:predicted secreted protein
MRLKAALVALLLGSSAAVAADGAAFNALGYSPDSRYFAFEQYGVQDGSGFPYWDIFIIDLKTNEWVKGTPARALVESEEAKPSDARDKAMAAAAPLLGDRNITEPAEIIAANPATEVVADRSHMIFDRWYTSMGAKPGGSGTDIIRHELVVEPLPLPRANGCAEAFGENFGFRLTIKDLRAGTARTLHEDKAIPASRNCPFGYDVAAVVSQAGYPVTDRLVAIIGVYSMGFEGANHRFIAVPFTISD